MIEKRITSSELIKSEYPINSLADIHMLLGRWDITDDFEYWYRDVQTHDIIFVYKGLNK